jgi:hypothetical protein
MTQNSVLLGQVTQKLRYAPPHEGECDHDDEQHSATLMEDAYRQQSE